MKKKIILVVVLCLFSFILYFLNLKKSTIYTSDSELEWERFLITEVMPDDVKIINIKDMELTTDDWQDSAPVCITPISTDSDSFGSSLAINKKYLAVGDSDANHVIIYKRNESGRWIRLKEISPPKNSIPDRIGHGFASKSLDLYGDTLIIKSYINALNSNGTIEKNFSAIYKIIISKENIPEPINANLITIDNQKTVFIQYPNNKDHFSSKGDFKIGIKKTISDSKISYLKTRKYIRKIKNFYPSSIALKNNLLLISDYVDNNEVYAWLFNLNDQKNAPQSITLPNVETADTIEISDDLIVINANFIVSKLKNIPIDYFPITIIKSINSNVTTIINNYQRTQISLDKNILVMLFPLPKGNIGPNILKIFRIDAHYMPHLIANRVTDKERIVIAEIQDGLLATSRVLRNPFRKNICIEDLSKLN